MHSPHFVCRPTHRLRVCARARCECPITPSPGIVPPPRFVRDRRRWLMQAGGAGGAEMTRCQKCMALWATRPSLGSHSTAQSIATAPRPPLHRYVFVARPRRGIHVTAWSPAIAAHELVAYASQSPISSPIPHLCLSLF
eukprot:366091-Chlamydomonas_euryale.AAC.8